MSAYEIVPCKLRHIRALASNLRDADRDEIELAGLVPRHALAALWRSSIDPYAGIVDGDVAACWGDAAPLMAREGSMWLFTTPAIERVPLAYFKEARREIARRLQFRDSLFANVPCSYERSLRFFKMLGFQISDMADNVLYREIRIARGI